MIRIFVSTSVALLFLLVSLLVRAAETAPDDVKGWLDTWWGMTPAQLEQLEIKGLAREETGNGGYKYLIEEYELFGTAFRVSFYWNNRRLAKVELHSTRMRPMFPPRRDLSDKIVSLMVSKYGEPASHTLKDDMELDSQIKLQNQYYEQTFRWIFDSTMINVKHVYNNLFVVPDISDAATADIIKISYERNDVRDKL